ncbi:hypothetical protein UA08_05166 [Talaromyces atroroseus]|uniref:Malate dehydrogenase n=1 Tax=Talaromyces atroroseus TaxID=1441469 RepID=A0A225AQ10_TALAT|nr:hypothetical protein UA08_05166 [Talaromyces atroroseus]OKL59348.1 hypothetical protein UA08_05166 [Talaromyces atroroseus]
MGNYLFLLFLPLSLTVQLANAMLGELPVGVTVFDDASTILISAQNLGRNSPPGVCRIPSDVQAPFNGGSTPLSTPPMDSIVTYLALGVGYQNYTCDASSTDPPVPIGATANLFDVSCMAENTNFLAGLPRALQYMSPDSVVLAAVVLDKFTASINDTTNGFLLGSHYFTGSPAQATFDLSLMGGSIIQGAKLSSSTAPTTAPSMSVDWLRLGNITPVGIDTTNITDIYRVWTAGGQPGNCAKKAETLTIKYSAIYFFYS